MLPCRLFWPRSEPTSLGESSSFQDYPTVPECIQAQTAIVLTHRGACCTRKHSDITQGSKTEWKLCVRIYDLISICIYSIQLYIITGQRSMCGFVLRIGCVFVCVYEWQVTNGVCRQVFLVLLLWDWLSVCRVRLGLALSPCSSRSRERERAWEPEQGWVFLSLPCCCCLTLGLGAFPIPSSLICLLFSCVGLCCKGRGRGREGSMEVKIDGFINNTMRGSRYCGGLDCCTYSV